MSATSSETFTRETEKLFIERSILLDWIGVFFFPLFSVLDFFVSREHFLTFLVWRLLFAFFLVLILALVKKKRNYQLTLFLDFIAYLSGGALISMMCLVMEDQRFIYYGGVILMIIGITGLLPITSKQALTPGFSIVGVYILFTFSPSEHISPSLLHLSNNVFFCLLFILASSVLCHKHTQIRLRQFTLRNKIESLGKQLALHTRNLQSSVDKQMEKIEKSEIRFHYLYDKISDFVVLIDQNGKYLIENSQFKEIFKNRKGTGCEASFFDTVCPEDRTIVQNDIIDCLHNNHSISGVEFRLKPEKDKTIAVECNARRIKNCTHLNHYQLIMRDITERKKLQNGLRKSRNQINQARMAIIMGLAQLAEYRDSETGGHLEQMREYSRILAEELSTWPKYKEYLTQTYIKDIYYASVLHDIGKVGIPDDILFKPGKLIEEEYNIMKNHSLFGGDVLETVVTENTERSFLTLAEEIAYFHHEKWDGSGYPNGLQANAIPLSATIVALADVYDALTSKRCYKPAFSHEKAKQIIINGKEKHFAPDIVEAFLRRENDFIQTRKNILIQLKQSAMR
ncbi:MAG TPA: HD domain-containing protein [Desulfobacterales bacterium]|nr:HD domain-containing protein [Desulfobacterales bacterium]HIP38544.1 HD domain-containing protein [Desulfocapsa sulfexigens]